MKIAVLGLWHLGSVTAACLAEAGFATLGIDFDAAVVARLRDGRAPLFEPGLDDLVAAGLASGRLDFTTAPAAAAGCDIVWVAYDTPVDDDDRADPAAVTAAAARLFPHLSPGTVVLVSSQLPVGSTRGLAAAFAAARPAIACHFAYLPENLRLGGALDAFRTTERIVVGRDDPAVEPVLRPVLEKFTGRILWMSPESAEMTKHALNAFLATSVAFANEVAGLCEGLGADAADVERALRAEPRIGPRAYLKPGGAFAGGTLARDVAFLNELAARVALDTPLLASVLPSNRVQRDWPLRRLVQRLGDLRGHTVAVLGLAYKPGTDTLRRSAALELCVQLVGLGARVQAFDPAVRGLPPGHADVALAAGAGAALAGADAAVVATEWPEFRALTAADCVAAMRRPLICDPNRFLAATLGGDARIDYLAVGLP